jgi:hypothetical protein
MWFEVDARGTGPPEEGAEERRLEARLPFGLTMNHLEKSVQVLFTSFYSFNFLDLSYASPPLIF